MNNRTATLQGSFKSQAEVVNVLSQTVLTLHAEVETWKAQYDKLLRLVTDTGVDEEQGRME